MESCNYSLVLYFENSFLKMDILDLFIVCKQISQLFSTDFV